MAERTGEHTGNRVGERSDALRTGPGRVLTFLYGLLALSASGRSVYQLATMFSEAPTAYLLSAVAALIYLVALIALVTDHRRSAVVACSIEFAGVMVVGTLSVTVTSDFPATTVWSGYGYGYGYLPAVLPILALIWIARAPRRAAQRSDMSSTNR